MSRNQVKSFAKKLPQSLPSGSSRPVAKAARYLLKVSLIGAQPAIWRRVLVQSHMNLAQLHEVLQRVMGWEDCHLHRFCYNGQYYAEYDAAMRNQADESKVRLCDLLQQTHAEMLYHYDFNDDWQHRIVLEKILPSSQSQPVAEVLVGEGACPREEIGGLDGWYYFLDVIAHPDSAEYQDEYHQHMCDWVAADFNPRYFDVKAVNNVLLKEF